MRFSHLYKTGLTLFFLLATTISAQNYAPVFDFEKVMDTYFDDSGLISFQDGKIIFAPKDRLNAQVAVVDQENKVLARFPFHPRYKAQEGVYARALVQAPADITLTKPGIYNIVYIVDGRPATRLPFRLVQTSAGDDPFNPRKEFAFDGYWRTFAFIIMDDWKGEEWPEVYYWLGGLDLPKGQNDDKQIVTLFRDGKMVAHSKTRNGFYKKGHFEKVHSHLYHIHPENKSYNARPFLLKDWLVDGVYELRVNRLSDKAALRSFDFRVVNGKIEGHPRSRLGYQPQTDYIAPRVQKRSSTYPELVEAIWIEDRPLK